MKLFKINVFSYAHHGKTYFADDDGFIEIPDELIDSTIWAAGFVLAPGSNPYGEGITQGGPVYYGSNYTDADAVAAYYNLVTDVVANDGTPESGYATAVDSFNAAIYQSVINNITTDDIPQGAVNLYETGGSAPATQIATSGTAVNINSTAPSAGQVLTASSSTAASWQSLNDIVIYDKGAINNTSTITFDLSQGSIHKFICGGAYTLTFAFSNWASSGTRRYVEVLATNLGLGTLAFSGTVQWKKKDDTYTTSFSTYLSDRGGETALKSSGLDYFMFWSDDAGTTVYGVLL